MHLTSLSSLLKFARFSFVNVSIFSLFSDTVYGDTIIGTFIFIYVYMFVPIPVMTSILLHPEAYIYLH